MFLTIKCNKCGYKNIININNQNLLSCQKCNYHFHATDAEKIHHLIDTLLTFESIVSDAELISVSKQRDTANI